MAIKNRGLTAIAVLTLALGIGANTAVFSVVRAALLRPIPVPDPERVVMVWTENQARGWHHFPASIPDYQDWKNSGIFESLGAFGEGGVNLRVGNRTERIKGLQVTPEVLEALGVQARFGRIFTAADTQGGQTPVAVLTPDLWRSTFASDPNIAGKTIVLDGVPRTVIGVLPDSFQKLSQEQLYTLLDLKTEEAAQRGRRSNAVIGKLRPGITLAAAQQRVDAISASLSHQFPEADAGNSANLQPVEEAFTEDVRPLVLVLFGAVGFVLLIACANIANLLLAQGAGRAKEMAIRAAMGAGRSALVGQLLTESLLLALLGGALGVVPALWGIDFIASFHMTDLPNAGQLRLDAGILAFTLLLSIATGIIFGLAPAWQVWRTDVNETLKQSGRGNVGGAPQRLRSIFVTSEIALTLVLLVGAGLTIRSLWEFRSSRPGYDPRNVLTLRIALSERQYATPKQQSAYFTELTRQVRQTPGVIEAGAVTELPTSDDLHGRGLLFADRPEPKPTEIPIVIQSSVTPGYFRSMRIPLVEGREFTDADNADAPGVALVDQWTARHHWPNGNPIGSRIKLGRQQPYLRVVGIVGDVEQGILIKALKGRIGNIYLPVAQEPEAAMALAVRTAGDPMAVATAVQRIGRQMDPDQPVFEIRSLETARTASSASQRLAATVLGGFAVVALLLAAIGIYGVVSYGVNQRTREIGVRMALGAERDDVLRLLLGNGFLMTLAGVAIGLAGAFALIRALSSLVYGIALTDPLTFAVVPAVVLLTAMLASYIPARRAARLEPVNALRGE